jgi:hypothetical protein
MKSFKIAAISGALLLAAAAHARNNFIVFKIVGDGTVVTRDHNDLLRLMELNNGTSQMAVRSFFKQLTSQGSAVVLQTGDVVRVSDAYNDGTAQIVFGNHHGYIAQADLQLRAQ